MKTELQKALAPIAPSIAIRTIWEHDEDARFSADGMTKPGGCFHGEDPDDWQAWQSEVRASAIVNGEEISGSGYMSGTWEKYGDNPAESNPAISGYENQMTVKALEDLQRKIPYGQSLDDQINPAIAYCQEQAKDEHERQSRERSMRADLDASNRRHAEMSGAIA